METVMSETHKCSYPEQFHKLSLFQPLTIHSESSFFLSLSYLCRLPASLDWSAGLPRPDGSTAVTSWPGCNEQSARSPSAGRDGLLPNHVFLSGAYQQLEKPGHKLTLSRANTTGHSLWWVVSRIVDAWPVHTSVDLDWDREGEKVCRCHSKCLGFSMLNWICFHINFLFVEGNSSLAFYTGRPFGRSIKMILDRKPNIIFCIHSSKLHSTPVSSYHRCLNCISDASKAWAHFQNRATWVFNTYDVCFQSLSPEAF